MSGGKSGDDLAAQAVHKVASRAVRRLDAAEWILLGASMFLAILGGGLLALLLAGPLGVPFRVAWTVASVLMFGVPGLLALRKMRREDREFREKSLTENGESHV